MKEIEVRTRLTAESVRRMAKILTELGFQFLGSRQQTDVMFDRPDGSLFNSGHKIRLRREQGNMELTYKGSMLGRTDVSIRTETNVRVSADQFDECKSLLEALGFPELFRIIKERQSWRRDSVTATIDEWPIIGHIMEIEGPESDLAALSTSLDPSYQLANYRLRHFFEEVQKETRKSLEELQKEYEAQNGVSLGRLDLLIG